MRTTGAFFGDTAHNGGFFLMDAIELTPISANTVLTRNALGNYSLNRTAAGAETYTIVSNLSSAIRKLTLYPGLNGLPFQEQFGTAAGAAGYPAAAGGLPPFTGATELVPPTAPVPKGIQVSDVVAIYQVGVVDATAASLSLNRTIFANNVAPNVVNIPVAATALPLTAAGDATGPYVVVRAVTAPVFEVTDLSDVTLEFSVTLANTGTLKAFALGFHFNYNLN